MEIKCGGETKRQKNEEEKSNYASNCWGVLTLSWFFLSRGRECYQIGFRSLGISLFTIRYILWGSWTILCSGNGISPVYHQDLTFIFFRLSIIWKIVIVKYCRDSTQFYKAFFGRIRNLQYEEAGWYWYFHPNNFLSLFSQILEEQGYSCRTSEIHDTCEALWFLTSRIHLYHNTSIWFTSIYLNAFKVCLGYIKALFWSQDLFKNNIQ